jgi:hypothetical protein
MSIIADSLLPRPKLDCDVSYDAAMKGAIVVNDILQPRLEMISIH